MNKSSNCWFSSQMVAMTEARLGLSQKLGIGAKAFRPLLTASRQRTSRANHPDPTSQEEDCRALWNGHTSHSHPSFKQTRQWTNKLCEEISRAVFAVCVSGPPSRRARSIPKFHGSSLGVSTATGQKASPDLTPPVFQGESKPCLPTYFQSSMNIALCVLMNSMDIFHYDSSP